MNRFLLFFLLFYTFSQAQFTLDDHNGNFITDGQVITYNTVGAELGLNITNTSTESINVKLQVTGVVNTDGNNCIICIFGQCYPYVVPGEFIPATTVGFSIAAGQTSDPNNFDHFINNDSGSGTFPIDYNFKFFQVDAQGIAIGTPINFTYRYNPSAGIEDDFLETVHVFPTVSQDFIYVDSQESIQFKLTDLQGKIHEIFDFSTHHIFDLSHLSSQMYILIGETKSGKKHIQKVLKY